MDKRDRQKCAALFLAICVPIMAGVWWVATAMTQALVGLVLLANDVPPGPVIDAVPSSEATYIFVAIAAPLLLLGCLWCRYGYHPDPVLDFLPPHFPKIFR